MEAIILAGGLGTRLREVLPDHPKPMAPVAGRPFLEHLLDYWIGQDISRFILSVGYMHDAIRSHFAEAYRGVPIAYAIEASPRGTGGGLLLACSLLGTTDTFLALNGDTLFAVPLNALHELHKRSHADMTLALHSSTDTKRYLGIELGNDRRLLAFRNTAGDGALYVNGGVYVIEPHALAAYRSANVPISLEADILPELLHRNALLYGYPSAAPFLDIGIPTDYARAASMLAP